MVSAAVDGGKLMGYFNLPWFAWGSAEMNLGDSEEYNTLVRVTSPYDRLATAIIKLFVYYNVWSAIYSDSIVVYSALLMYVIEYVVTVLLKSLQRHCYVLSQFFRSVVSCIKTVKIIVQDKRWNKSRPTEGVVYMMKSRGSGTETCGHYRGSYV